MSEVVQDSETVSEIQASIRSFLLQKDYPCIGALRALHRDEIRLGVFRGFGSGQAGPRLRDELRRFLEEQRRQASDYLTYWAVFDDAADYPEEEFERRLWAELSALTSVEERDADWAGHVADPESRQFAFCLFGEPFFVVGLSPRGSRRGRRFSRPSLVFNVFRQFESLQRAQAYAPMVRTNRQRDIRFDGRVNPVAEEFGEQWESIQFSGRPNTAGWKCPFRFLSGRKKGPASA